MDIVEGPAGLQMSLAIREELHMNTDLHSGYCESFPLLLLLLLSLFLFHIDCNNGTFLNRDLLFLHRDARACEFWHLETSLFAGN